MKIWLMVIILLFSGQLTMAEDDGFANNEEEIYLGLTRGMSGETQGVRGVKIENKKPGDQKMNLEASVEKSQRQVMLKIEFDYDSSRIRPASYKLLADLGRALQRDGLFHAQIDIIGHTDSDGSMSYNDELSLARARSVSDFLVDQCRVEKHRLAIFGYGERLPLKLNSNARNKQINRRVEIVAH